MCYHLRDSKKNLRTGVFHPEQSSIPTQSMTHKYYKREGVYSEGSDERSRAKFVLELREISGIEKRGI
jgi:hypothetical protein